MDRIDLYRQRGDKLKKLFTMREWMALPVNNFMGNSFYFPITPEKARMTTWIMCFQTRGTMRFPLYIWEKSAFLNNIKKVRMLFSIYLGLFLTMFLFYLLSFSYNRDRQNIYFPTFLLFFIIFQNTNNGIIFDLLQPAHLSWKYTLFCTSGLFSILFGILFSQAFLNIRQKHVVFQRAFQAIIAATIIFILSFSFIPETLAIITIGIFGLAACSLILVTSVILLVSGYRPARLFFAAWLALIASALLYLLRGFGLLPNNFLTLNSMYIGGASAMIFLGLAIADRYFISEKERNRTKSTMIKREKEARLAREKMIDQLQRLDRLKDEFLANTSHELKTPLHGIIGIAESILETNADELPGDVSRGITMIAESGMRLNSLVSDILDYSKIRDTKASIDMNSVDLRPLADTCIELLAPLVESTDISLTNNITADIPPVEADEDRLLQILYNLVGNAIKFSLKGNISIGASCLKEKNAVKISVSDEGPGIPADRLRYIFLPFQQGDGSMERSHEGAGLGLSITKRLVELHGSEIKVTSKVGFGSTFSFLLKTSDTNPLKVRSHEKIALPAAPPTGQNDYTSEEVRLPPQGKHLVLIADDDPVSLHVVCSILEKEGLATLRVEDGLHVIKELEEGARPDLLLLDVMMPRMSGYEVTRKVRQKYSMLEMPIMLLTAKNRSEDMVLGFEAGANDFLTKPVNREELTARLSTLLTMKDAVSDSKRLNYYERDIQVARSIQQSNIPAEVPLLESLKVAARYIPFDEVAGDFYDFFPAGKNALGILVTDVSGHGIASALIASMIRIASSMQHSNASQPEQVLQNLRTILDSAIENQFFTAIYAYIDTDSAQLSVSRAGHDAALLYRKSDDTISRILPAGKMIGFGLEEKENDVITCSVSPGDRLILYTDCAFEVTTPQGEMLGKEKFLRLVYDTLGSPPGKAIDEIIESLYHWSGTDRLQDDLTLIVVDING